MSIWKRTFAAVTGALLVTACGGGSSSTAPNVAGSATTVAVPNGPLATATITLRFPANFHQATVRSASLHRSTASTRSAQYINPRNSNTIHVYVQPTYSSSTVTELTPSAGIPVNPIGAGADNTQTIGVSIPSGTYYKFSVIEQIGTNQIAGYTTFYQSISPGMANQLSFTMDMNAQNVVLTTNPTTAADAVVLSTSSSTPTPFCAYNPTQALYAFAADSTGGFVVPGTIAGGPVDNSQNAAVPQPYVSSQSDSAGAAIAASGLGLIAVIPASGSINATFSEQNLFNGNSIYNSFASIGSSGSTQCTPAGTFTPSVAYTNAKTILQISGGSAPYVVSESDGYCSSPSQLTPNLYYFNGITPGATCGINITDAHGTPANGTSASPLPVNVTVSSSASAITLSPPSGFDCTTPMTTLTTTISGGTAPYTILGNTSPAQFTASIAGSTLTIGAAAYAAGAVSIQDSASNVAVFTMNGGC